MKTSSVSIHILGHHLTNTFKPSVCKLFTKKIQHFCKALALLLCCDTLYLYCNCFAFLVILITFSYVLLYNSKFRNPQAVISRRKHAFVLNTVDKHGVGNRNSGLSVMSHNSAWCPMCCWAFLTVMHECSGEKGEQGLNSGSSVCWGHILQWQLYACLSAMPLFSGFEGQRSCCCPVEHARLC